jgi:hypothetical protein
MGEVALVESGAGLCAAAPSAWKVVELAAGTVTKIAQPSLSRTLDVIKSYQRHKASEEAKLKYANICTPSHIPPLHRQGISPVEVKPWTSLPKRMVGPRGRKEFLFQEKNEKGLRDLQEARRRAGRSRRKDKILNRRCVVSRQHASEE